MSSINGRSLVVWWLLGYYDAERRRKQNSVPYNCSYATDHGCSCSAWVRDGEQYCAKHKEPMAKIDDLEKEMNDVVKKAREK